MFRKKLMALMMAAICVTSFTACGDSTAVMTEVQETSAVATEATKQTEPQTTLSAEEAASRAEEIKASMADSIANGGNAAATTEAPTEETATSTESMSLGSSYIEENVTEAAQEQAVGVDTSAQLAGADDEVVTVVDSYGIDSAWAQYNANYAIYVELVRLTNELRASLGVAPLTMEENICIASCKKAVDYYLADYYDGANHTMIDGRRWQSLFEDFNIQASSRAENLAKGSAYKTARQMFEGWKNSAIHYENMVNPAYTRIGVGSCGYVWFMDLAG